MISYGPLQSVLDKREPCQSTPNTGLSRRSTIPRTILLIDDDANLRWLQNRLLAAHGYHCMEAADGLAGLSAVEQYQPSLVLLDLMMPNMDGLTFLKTIRQHNREIGIIVLSAVTARAAPGRPVVEGADGYLTKPINRQNLLHEIERVSQLVALRKAVVR